MTNMLFRAFDVLHVPLIFEKIWHLLTRVRILTKDELDTASKILGRPTIKYNNVRVSEGRILGIIFLLNRQRAFTTFHTVNLPSPSNQQGTNLGLLVHELVHVYQYETCGSIYLWQALRAQRKEGYDYGGWERLREDRKQGLRYSAYNREQQGQIVEDYYRKVFSKDLSTEDLVRQAYEPFITDLRNGTL